MQRIIEQKQMKDFMRLYTGLVERCFESCCNDFTSKALSSKEVRRRMTACDSGKRFLGARTAYPLHRLCCAQPASY